jgi:hypothetical protein
LSIILYISRTLKFSNENGIVKIELLVNNFFKINDKIDESEEFVKEIKNNQNLVQIIEEFKIR